MDRMRDAIRRARFKGLRTRADNRRAVNDMGTFTSSRRRLATLVAALVLGAAVGTTPALAQTQGQTQPPRTTPPATRPAQPTTGTPRPTQGPSAIASTGIALPTDYTIGPDDVLGIVFWRDTDMTGDVTVRPDGMVTLPLLKDIKAAGLTPAQLTEQIQKAASTLIEDPNVTVVVRQINSRNVFITGQVARPGPYPVSGQMTVLHLIAIAGGLTEFANDKDIRINRVEAGQTKSLKFNYREVAEGKKLEQNVVLKPGDTVMVR
jgi:polysaccharide export outer membrane protein